MRYFLCAAVLCVVFSITQAATVEWCFLGTNPPMAPLSTSFVTSSGNPNISDTISFVSPANGEIYFNSFAAADAFGNPVIAVDSTNQTIAVTFTAPLHEAIPDIVLPVGGVNGQFGPLDAGTWVFSILTNSYTFTVTGPPLGIAPAGDQVVISWTALASNYALQVMTNLSSGSWMDVTNGITTNGTNCVLTAAVSNRAASYRLRQE